MFSVGPNSLKDLILFHLSTEKNTSMTLCPRLSAFEKLRKVTIGFVMYLRGSAWEKSAPTGRIFMTFDI
jgi:hypothetical protein